MPIASARPPVAPEAPLTEAGDRFQAALEALAPPGRLALAVSGGGDSLALLLLARDWSQRSAGRALDVLTIDHGLRPESLAEAAMVGAVARRLGLPHHVLRPTEELPRRGLEAAARACRYRLIVDWCRRNGVAAVATGHSEDDQAETLLMRLARGSGLDGLSAMAPASTLGPIRLLRPLLGFSRAELAALVADAGLVAADDPMNHDDGFARVRMRRAIATLGLDRSGLAATAARLRRDRAVIDGLVDDLVGRAVALSSAGVARIERDALRGQASPLVERALGRLVRAVGGGDYAPRRERVERLAALLAAPGDFAGATLGGCRFLAGRERVTVLREARRLGPDLALAAGAGGVWDGRFEVEAGDAAIVVRALGALRPEGLPPLPAEERRILPGIFLAGRLVAVPSLDFGAPQVARLRYCAPGLFSV